MDDDAILGLTQVTNAAGCAQRKVNFSRYELIRTLGWRHEGKSYRRLETSLHRWLGVTLHYVNAWWDRAADCWVSESFHILDNVRLVHRYQRQAQTKTPHSGAEPASSFIVWNDVIFRNLQDGHLKKLDMGLYRQLDSAVAKRMFRFLDKRFYQSTHWVFELKRFACEHIGLSRCYGCAELKRLLNPAILELEQLGFLQPRDKASRFRQLRRGHWEVRFRRAARQGGQRRASDPAGGISGDLVARGINPRIAPRLAMDYSQETLRKSIARFDQVMNQSGGPSLRNPPGLLVEIIRNSECLPAVSLDSNRKEPVSRSNVGGRIATAQCGRQKGSSTARKERVEIRRYLERLSADERQRLEEEAYATASGICRDGLTRAQEQDRAELVPAYEEAMLFSHVRRILRATDK